LVVQRAPASVVETPRAAPSVEQPLVEQRAPASVVETPRAGDRPLRVLYVCTANICRSPYMELLSRHLAGPDAAVTFESAGTHGFNESPMDAVMAATLPARGVASTDAFRSRPFTSGTLTGADLVLTAEAAHRQFILDDHPAAFRKVFTLSQFAEAVEAAGPDLHGHDLLRAVAERRGAADPTLDISDPYRRGTEAAEACAVAVERLLRVVVPALTGSKRIAP
jgi:sulfate adenylyltransferase